MSIEKNKIVKTYNTQWSVEDDLVVIRNNGEKFIFNKTMSVVWMEINGILTVDQIIEKLYDLYKDQNTMEHMEQVVEDSISQLMQIGIVYLEEKNLFAGWCSDEF